MNIIRKMKPLLWLLSALLSSTCLATDVYFNLADFNASPVTNRTVTLQAQSPFSGATVFYTSDANGELTVSNMAASLYFGEIKAPPQRIAFKLNITSTNLGTVNAMTVLASDSASTFPSGQVGWAAAASDRRYISTNNPIMGAFTNTASMTNAVASQVGTNIFTPEAISQLSGGAVTSGISSNAGTGYRLAVKDYIQVQSVSNWWTLDCIVLTNGSPTYTNFCWDGDGAYTNADGWIALPTSTGTNAADSTFYQYDTNVFIVVASSNGPPSPLGVLGVYTNSFTLNGYKNTTNNFYLWGWECGYIISTNGFGGGNKYYWINPLTGNTPATGTNWTTNYDAVCGQSFIGGGQPPISFYGPSNSFNLYAPSNNVLDNSYSSVPTNVQFVIYSPITNASGVVTQYWQQATTPGVTNAVCATAINAGQTVTHSNWFKLTGVSGAVDGDYAYWAQYQFGSTKGAWVRATSKRGQPKAVIVGSASSQFYVYTLGAKNSSGAVQTNQIAFGGPGPSLSLDGDYIGMTLTYPPGVSAGKLTWQLNHPQVFNVPNIVICR